MAAPLSQVWLNLINHSLEFVIFALNGKYNAKPKVMYFIIIRGNDEMVWREDMLVKGY